MPKPTQGPWIIFTIGSNKYHGDNRYSIMPAIPELNHSHAIASVLGTDAKANARLIAAAPDLLKALQEIAEEGAPCHSLDTFTNEICGKNYICYSCELINIAQKALKQLGA